MSNPWVYLVGASLDIFQTLIGNLDTEGRYLFLNAIANQLRYPNNHTHYFSFILLHLFTDTDQVHIMPVVFFHCFSDSPVLAYREDIVMHTPIFIHLFGAGNHPRADHKSVTGKANCKQTSSMGSSNHLP